MAFNPTNEGSAPCISISFHIVGSMDYIDMDPMCVFLKTEFSETSFYNDMSITTFRRE